LKIAKMANVQVAIKSSSLPSSGDVSSRVWAQTPC